MIETVQGSVREQAAYLVDMAKADALDLLGESRQAFEFRNSSESRTLTCTTTAADTAASRQKNPTIGNPPRARMAPPMDAPKNPMLHHC